MEKFYQKLWEIECKLEELKDAFVESKIDEAVAREYAPKLAELEASFTQLIDFIAMKKGIQLPTISTKEDVEKILLWETQKAKDAYTDEHKKWLEKKR
jgi:hypothetical protein